MNQQKRKPQKRILIIGAGPSGLSLLRALQRERQNCINFPQILCCQKQSEWGGQWNYITKQKLDKNGIPIASTNQYLWTNAPKQCFEYPDYSFDKHFNQCPMPSYLPRQYLREYFTKRFQQTQIKKYIKFETIAQNIEYSLQTKKFTANIQNLQTKHKTIQQFDFVIVASGHYSSPNVPQIQGLKQFQGKLLHSIQVKDYLDYLNQDVLIIGTGLSAEDAVLQCYKYGAKSITVTYRTKPMSQKFPQQIEQYPLLTKVESRTVTFKNGVTKQFDTIIMCTGYMHNFSFLHQSLRLSHSTSLWSKDLYMGVVYQQNPQLMYIGMQAQYFSFMMFDIQSHLAKEIILQKCQLPQKKQMNLITQLYQRQQKLIKTSYDVINFMGKYLTDLMKMCNYDYNYDLQKVIDLYKQLQKHKQHDILTFRDNIYQSSVSGKWSIMKKVSWLEAGHKFENDSDQTIQTIEDKEKQFQSKSQEKVIKIENIQKAQNSIEVA